MSEGRSPTILVFEYVTGGGLAGRELPASWASEGAAMRRAIARDFAAVPGARVLMTLDSRLAEQAIPDVAIVAIPDPEGRTFGSLAAEADYTALIAPEADGILADLARVVVDVGGRSLGSSRRAVDFVGDKARLAEHLAGLDISSPPTLALGRGPVAWPETWPGPVVIKPRWGAGSVDTVVVQDRRGLTRAGRGPMFVVQPYLPGDPMSASFLVDAEGGATLLAIGRQRIEVDLGGKITYRGGTIPAGLETCPIAVEAALASVVLGEPGCGLRGFVGVDFLLDDRARATVLEINPRPTTSFVGLARLLPPGTIAGAWLAAHDRPLAGTDWPDRLRPARTAAAVMFDADGTISRERPSR